MSEKKHLDTKVLIVGSGAAGLSAAIYTARAELEPVVLTGPTLGGQITLTADVENYPGVPERISGTELIMKFADQAEKFGAKIDYTSAESIDFAQRPFVVETEGKIYHAESLILATGSKAVLMNVPGEKELTGAGVSYCATCDGAFYRGKNVAVVGGGTAAVEEAVFLTRFVNKVTIIHRRDQLRADAAAQKKAKANPKIDFLWDSVVTEVVGKDFVEALNVRNVKSGEERRIPFDGVFVFIGHKPISELYEGKLSLKNGLIPIDTHMRTEIPGVYAAGETVDGDYRQLIVSAASGAQAAMTLIKDRGE